MVAGSRRIVVVHPAVDTLAVVHSRDPVAGSLVAHNPAADSLVERIDHNLVVPPVARKGPAGYKGLLVVAVVVVVRYTHHTHHRTDFADWGLVPDSTGSDSNS